MKKYHFLFILALLFPVLSFAGNLQAYLSYTTFYSPSEGPYIETYLTVLANSVTFVKNDSGKFQATVEISMIFKKNDVITDFNKVDLLSPAINDTSQVNFSFTDQQRFLLPEGDYEVEIQLLDKNRKEAHPYKTIESLTISFPDEKINVSGIEFVESYKKTEKENVLSKNGYDLVPLCVNYYPQSVNVLTFYAEVYNTAKVFTESDKFIIRYYIEAFETGKIVADYVKFKVEKSKQVIVLLDAFDITGLPSGNYNLVIELRDKDNSRIAYNKAFFQRSNPAAVFKL